MPFTTAQLPFVPEGICRHCEQTDFVICCIKHNCDTICDKNSQENITLRGDMR
jgi:hypothetical protein